MDIRDSASLIMVIVMLPTILFFTFVMLLV